MTHPPVICLAFANDQDDYLAKLKKESREVKRALKELDRKQFIRLVREESAETTDVYQMVLAHREEMVIFHYAGHASGTHLQFEDGQGSREGLAQLLGRCPNLQLVVLNGCATRDHVQTLFAAGVPAVIATSVPVNDRKATTFSVAFYEALANRLSIQQAYDFAVVQVTFTFGEGTFAVSSLVWEDDEPEDVLTWGLYLRTPEAQATYRLPYYRELRLPKSVFASIKTGFPANRYILNALEAMCQSNPDIYSQMVEQRGDEQIPKDSSQFPVLIIQNFPWPIGSQIRLLHLRTQPNRERLQTLLSLYSFTGQLLYYLLLSDRWDQYHRQPATQRPGWTPISNRAAYRQTDFFAAFRAAYEVAPDLPLFVPELEQFYADLTNPGSPLAKAYAYLHPLCAQALQGQWPSTYEKTCLQAEQAVAVLLRSVAFLARFRMITVRNVLVDYPRFAPLTYELDMGPLNASESVHLRLYQDEARRRKSQYANCRSIILVPDESAIHQSLNLSPFLMDANTFAQIKNSQNTEEAADDVANVFLLGWEDGERLIYLTVNHDLFTALDNERNTDQLHTDLRQDDFDEGRNLDEEELDLGFDFGFEEENKEESPRVFELLKEQYELLKAEMGGNG